jgi:hypothetical protein
MIRFIFPHRHLALRALRAIPGAPSREERCACHAGIALLRARSWSRSFAQHQVSFLPRLSKLGEEAEGERKVRVLPRTESPCRRSGRGWTHK